MNCQPYYGAPSWPNLALSVCSPGYRPLYEQAGAAAVSSGALSGLGCPCPGGGLAGLGNVAVVPGAGRVQDLAGRVRSVSPTAASHAIDAALPAFASAIHQAERQNKNESDAAYGRAMAYVQRVASEAPKVGANGGLVMALFAELMKVAAETSRLMERHLARTPEEQARYAEGIAAAEASWSRYRDYDDVRRPIEADIAEAAAATARDAGRLVGGVAQLPREALAWAESNKLAIGAAALGLGALYLYARGRGAGRRWGF